ncbi:MAG: phosphoribosylglycinamide formyltransferase [Cyclobacteriaceae bacterium]
MKQEKIAIFASGSGTNAENICRYFEGHPRIEVALILTPNPQAGVLERAKTLGIPSVVFNRASFREKAFLQTLAQYQTTFVVLAGFMWLVPSYLIESFPNRIVNIHPALLPKFGGKGMYGMHVHEAVLTAKEGESGITIHYVNQRYDEGKIIFQATCPVDEDDAPEHLAEKVHQLEYLHYPQVIEKLLQ